MEAAWGELLCAWAQARRGRVLGTRLNTSPSAPFRGVGRNRGRDQRILPPVPRTCSRQPSPQGGQRRRAQGSHLGTLPSGGEGLGSEPVSLPAVEGGTNCPAGPLTLPEHARGGVGCSTELLPSALQQRLQGSPPQTPTPDPGGSAPAQGFPAPGAAGWAETPALRGLRGFGAHAAPAGSCFLALG